AYAMFRESYTSRIVLDPANLSIDVSQLSGPFETLTNRWRFHPEGEGTRVEFELAYAFRSRLMQAAAGAVLDKAFSKFAEAFERRADAVYGPGRRQAIA
ncbi:MAG: type II toxin-antitoxin system RatA family toxin, partial [Flavobacteriaceae bacterium]